MRNLIIISIITFSILSSAVLFADEKTTTSVSVTKSNKSTDNTVTQSTTTTTTTTTSDHMDENIVTAIYAKYAKDPALIGTTITATSKDGIVTLNGTVTAQSQADEAVIAAKAVPNVKDVRSFINVTTNPKANKPASPTPNY